MTRNQKERLAERLIRNAYDLEQVANRMKAENLNSESEGVRVCASKLGYIGRSLRDLGAL